MQRTQLFLSGRFVVEHRDRDEDLKAIYEIPNGIVDVGLNHILEIEFNGGSQISTWYIGLVDNAAFSAFADADTLSSHSGWAEFTSYTESNRVTWGSARQQVERSVTPRLPISLSMPPETSRAFLCPRTMSSRPATPERSGRLPRSRPSSRRPTATR